LKSPDKLIIEIQNKIQNKKYCSFNGLMDVQWFDEFDFNVSPKCISRALRILNSLIKLLKVRGHEIKQIYRETKVVILGTEINISMREKLKKTERIEWWSGTQCEPTGILAIYLDRWSSVTEYKDGIKSLEEQLFRVVAMLENELPSRKMTGYRKPTAHAECVIKVEH